MWIIDWIKKCNAKKNIARKLPRILKKNYGRHKQYTKAQIDRACSSAKIPVAYNQYAHAMYMSRERFRENCGDEATYDSLRSEMAESFYDGNTGFIAINTFLYYFGR